MRETPEDPAAMTDHELENEIEWAYLLDTYEIEESA